MTPNHKTSPPSSFPPLPHGRDELLCHHQYARVFRRYFDGEKKTCVCKEYLGATSIERQRHELRILERLAGVPSVPQLSEYSTPPHLIAMEDLDGVPLTSVPRYRIDLLQFATELTDILAQVHERGVVHKDICPDNILIKASDGTPCLLDFSIATTAAEERPGFVHQSEIAGTLAFLAPEQTGRTGKSVDQRADLYALGATLYWLAAGQAVFEETDPLHLVHHILARVPIAPHEVNPDVPIVLSDIILRLLDKEPDQRYQSAEGLLHDLTRLHDARKKGYAESFVLGESDFPQQLSSPSRLVGRDREIATLKTAFEGALQGHGRGLFVTGSPGVGKTTLIRELKEIVAKRNGWFVSGKFDQYRQDQDTDAVRQALRGLGRLLLAEPEDNLAELRERIRQALGPNIGLISSILPEFAALLNVTEEFQENDPQKAEQRLSQAFLELLRTIASPARPVVLIIDDLQWAASTPVHLLDAALLDTSLPGLFVVGSYREREIDAAHPLTPYLARWSRLGISPPFIHLEPLQPNELSQFIGEMLRLSPDESARLAALVSPHTGGNPYDTVELLNALRREGSLTPSSAGWVWDEATVRRHAGQGDVLDLLRARIERLPQEARHVLEVLACLGGEVETELLGAALGVSSNDVEEYLTPALDDGLLVMELGAMAVRFRHDRVQQATYGNMSEEARRLLNLQLARRLATSENLSGVAAEQYLPAICYVDDPEERLQVARLLRIAASNTRFVNYIASERFLATAISLLNSEATQRDETLLADLEIEHHAALYCLGRLEEADAVYRSIEQRQRTPLHTVNAVCVQLDSLINRARPQQALALGFETLERLHLRVPQSESLDEEVERNLEDLYQWINTTTEQADIARKPADEPYAIAAADLINRMMPAAFFSEPKILDWLILESQRLWVKYGHCSSLVFNLSASPICIIARRDDYRTGYLIGRHALAVGDAHGYASETARARHAFSVLVQHWFEPLESCITQARQAREGMQQNGELQMACFTYFMTLAGLLDCSPHIEACATESQEGLSYAARTSNDHGAGSFVFYRQFTKALRGGTQGPGSFSDDDFNEQEHLSGLHSNPMAVAIYQILRAGSAVIFGDSSALAQYSEAAMPLLPYIRGFYTGMLAYLFRGLALAEALRKTPSDDLPAIEKELGVCRQWLALRASEQGENYEHLLEFLDAEIAWSRQDFQAAATAFDKALTKSQCRVRPWHEALITEHAARFYLAYGIGQPGQFLLREARRKYEAWGATAKVCALDNEFPLLLDFAPAQQSGTTRESALVSSQTIDLMAILKASHVLSSQTNLHRLVDSLVEVLSELTGATMVALLLRSDDKDEWFLSRSGGQAPINVEEAAVQDVLPLSAFRYVVRTEEPLLVVDALRDDRFSHDPHLAGLQNCSLMLVPIWKQGALRAVLLLENQLSQGAFTVERLDAVKLITGQLTVSLDNALLYASLEEKKEEAEAANASKSEFLSRISHELRTPMNAILGFGQLLEMEDLTPTQTEEVAHIMKGGKRLLELIDEVLDISRVETGRFEASIEPVCVFLVMEDALTLIRPLATEHRIVMPPNTIDPSYYVFADQHRLKQVLLNFLSNAIKYNRPGGSIRISGSRTEEGRIRIEVHDSGRGISDEDQKKLFTPFERLDAESRQIEGAGLGLLLSKRLTEAMQGEMFMESTAGEGSMFGVELPACQGPDENLAYIPDQGFTQSSLPVGTFTVLSIEDNFANLRLLEIIFRSRPEISLMTAMQGSVGLDLAEQHRPDVILLDIHLPDIPGNEILFQLQHSPATRSIPVIVISADATPTRRERLLNAGATAYLTKPLNVAEFTRILDDILLPNGQVQ